MRILISLLFMMSINQLFSQEKPTIIYVGDPMCSWCYGFSPQMTEALDSLGDDFEFKMVMGGLRAYGTESFGELKEFLTHHWEDVEKRSGQKFNYGILDSSDILYNTEPACRAVVAMRMLRPELELDFFKEVQTAFYLKNHNPLLGENYAAMAAEHGIDSSKFFEIFSSDSTKKETWEDFALAKELKATSFPSVLLYHKEQYFLVARGYLEAEKLESNIRNAANSVE